MRKEGYTEHISLLSMVAALLVLLATRGGILDNLPPLMHRRGVADDDIRVLVTGATGRTGAALVYSSTNSLVTTSFSQTPALMMAAGDFFFFKIILNFFFLFLIP